MPWALHTVTAHTSRICGLTPITCSCADAAQCRQGYSWIHDAKLGPRLSQVSVIKTSSAINALQYLCAYGHACVCSELPSAIPAPYKASMPCLAEQLLLAQLSPQLFATRLHCWCSSNVLAGVHRVSKGPTAGWWPLGRRGRRRGGWSGPLRSGAARSSASSQL